MAKFVTVLFRLAVFSVMLLVISVPVGAQQQSEQQEPASAAQEKQQTQAEPAGEAISDPQELGQWWLYSPLKYEPMYPKWLFHAQGYFSYTKLTGNVEGVEYSSELESALRKNRYTTYVLFLLSKTETTESVGGGHTENEDLALMVIERFDLTKRFALNVGMTWERESDRFVKDRFTYFGGPSVLVFEFPRHFLRVGFYYGYDDTQYDNDGLTSNGLPASEDLESDGVMFEQGYRLALTETLSFIESFQYLALFDDDDSYRWTFNPELNLQLTQHFSVFASYKMEEEKTPIFKVVEPIGAEKRDTTFTLGVSVRF